MSFIKKINELLIQNPKDFIYWIRLFLAILAGFLCSVLKLNIEGLVLGIVFYLTSYMLFRYFLKIDLIKVGGENKFYTIGLGSYLAMWITIWILSYTYLA